jgi:hypothetical protein
MSRETDWHVFDKAVEITTSAARGALGGPDAPPASRFAELFKEVYAALRETVDALESADRKTGF